MCGTKNGCRDTNIWDRVPEEVVIIDDHLTGTVTVNNGKEELVWTFENGKILSVHMEYPND